MRGFSRGHKFFHKEMDTIGNVLRKPSVCLDIGANYGLYSYFLSKLNHENKIIAFEPISSSFWVLKKTLSHFRLKNVHPVKIALDSRERRKNGHPHKTQPVWPMSPTPSRQDHPI
jgi:FkbM family methyltransferase